MKGLRLAALALILIGALAVAYPTITYTTRETVIDVGPLEVVKEDERRIPLMPAVGGAAIVLGLALFAMDRRRAS